MGSKIQRIILQVGQDIYRSTNRDSDSWQKPIRLLYSDDFEFYVTGVYEFLRNNSEIIDLNHCKNSSEKSNEHFFYYCCHHLCKMV